MGGTGEAAGGIIPTNTRTAWSLLSSLAWNSARSRLRMSSISAAHPQVGWVSPVLLVGRGEGLGVASEVPGMTPNSESASMQGQKLSVQGQVPRQKPFVQMG